MRVLFSPKIQALHVRNVTPEKRKELSSEINSSSVRNRFLLQLNNWNLSDGLGSFLCGIVFRNLIVLLGVFLTERSSIKGIKEFLVLWRRSWAIRSIIKEKERL